MNIPSKGLNVLVLAGTRPGAPDPMAQAAGVSHKAILPVAGTPMILRVLAALRATPAVGRIAVCIDNPTVLNGILPPDVGIIPSRPEGPSASVLAGLAQLGTPLLVTTADSALLRPNWITEFLEKCGPQCDVAAAVAPEAVVLRDVPGTKRTFIRLSDLAFSGCNLFLFNSPAAVNVATLWLKVEKNRKHPLRIAWLLGPMVLLKALCKKLSRAALCARIGKLTGARAELICLSDGRAAVDVDKPADLALTEKLIAAEAPA
ncbi:nucleotidyltransferase family protein [Acetobacter senegalensis]|uniref:nucleotidyltransferase family protein n=1 Tax=Acetobacter senegalensis TaxID=446692 RepID=UPI001EE07302|nr:nucleotidyltransferase family protein [Acetobacter senegalensis]MCG4273970.1 nucleotidyltransferase family protein [Acetobacter senegalensis]